MDQSLGLQGFPINAAGAGGIFLDRDPGYSAATENAAMMNSAGRNVNRATLPRSIATVMTPDCQRRMR